MANINKEIINKIINENHIKPYPINPARLRHLAKDFEAETIYIGSRSRNTASLLRIYDKKAEQTQ